MAFAASSHPSKCLQTSHKTFVVNYRVTPRVLVWQGKARENVSYVKLSHRAAAACVCMPFWRLNIFMVPLAQELFSCWKSGRNSPIQMVRKITSARLIQRQRLFWSRRQIEGWVDGWAGEQPLILNKHWMSLLSLILFAPALELLPGWGWGCWSGAFVVLGGLEAAGTASAPWVPSLLSAKLLRAMHHRPCSEATLVF